MLNRTTRKMIENQVERLSSALPGVELRIDSVNYQNPSRRYCLFANGFEQTGWLLVGEFYHVLKGMNSALELKSKL